MARARLRRGPAGRTKKNCPRKAAALRILLNIASRVKLGLGAYWTRDYWDVAALFSTCAAASWPWRAKSMASARTRAAS